MTDQHTIFFQLLKSKERFLIGCHVHPDGDAIGSMLAIGLALKKNGKQVAMVCSEGVPSVYSFLEGNSLITKELPDFFIPEVIIGVDCAEKDRLALSPEVWKIPDLVVVNLDHHITNIGFGEINIIDSQAAATGELVYRLLSEGDFEMDSAIAMAIYTAIATDTGFFRYDSTSAFTLELASLLVGKYHIKPSKIAEQVHEQKSFNSIRLLGEILSKLQLSNNGKIAWIVLDQVLLNKFPVENEETESFVNYARSIEGVEIGILFKEFKPNEVKLSWRSTTAVDVSKLAAYFGGGGHARAAGCNINGPMESVIKQVLQFVNEYYGEH